MFDQVIAALIAARRHIEFEEARVCPGLRDALSSAEARELGEKLSKAKEHEAAVLQRGTTAAARQFGYGLRVM